MSDNCRLRIAIDGPASCGKGTAAFLLAERIGYLFADTGAMYRTIALLAIRAGLNLLDNDGVGELAEKTTIAFRYMDIPGIGPATLADEVDVSSDIRSPEVDVASSKVAVLPRVREALVNKQRYIAIAGRVVMEGRDIATIVIPDAEVKIYLTASVEERARRRYLQRRARGVVADLDELINELTERDQRDSERSIGPLAVAPDAVIVDSTFLSVEETVDKLEQVISQRFPCVKRNG